MAVIDRKPSLSPTGDLKYQKVCTVKGQKNWRVQVVKEGKTFDFCPTLVSKIMKKRVADEKNHFTKN